jgi:hypothetical protein
MTSTAWTVLKRVLVLIPAAWMTSSRCLLASNQEELREKLALSQLLEELSVLFRMSTMGILSTWMLIGKEYVAHVMV